MHGIYSSTTTDDEDDDEDDGWQMEKENVYGEIFTAKSINQNETSAENYFSLDYFFHNVFFFLRR